MMKVCSGPSSINFIKRVEQASDQMYDCKPLFTFSDPPPPFLMDILMIALQGADAAFSLSVGCDALGGRDGCGQSGNIRNLIFDGCFTDIGVVIDT